MTTAPCVHWVMTTTGSEQAPAWLLHRHAFRNTSLIVDLFLPDKGRIGAVARGGRRTPALAPFRPLWVDLKASAGELFTVRQIEPRGPALPLRGTALYCGFYLNELLMRLLHRGEPQPDLWSAYQDSLAALTGDTPLDVTLRRFERVLLDEIGYALVLDHDADGQPLDDDGCYQWQPHTGLVIATEGYSGHLLRALAEDRWDDAVRRIAKPLFRAALAPYLGDKPLHSRELFR